MFKLIPFLVFTPLVICGTLTLVVKNTIKRNVDHLQDQPLDDYSNARGHPRNP